MKKLFCVVSLGLLLCFAFACQNKAEKAELEKFKAQAKLEQQNKEIVRHFFEEFNKGNIEIMNEVLSPDYSYYSPSNNPKPMSREEQIELERAFLKAFPDRTLRIEELFAAGDKVIILGVATGTHQGEYEGIPASGNKIEVSNIIIMSLKEGKIINAIEEANSLGLMQQLGMEVRPKETEKK